MTPITAAIATSVVNPEMIIIQRTRETMPDAMASASAAGAATAPALDHSLCALSAANLSMVYLDKSR